MKFAFAAALFFAGFAAAEKVNVEVQCRGMDYGKLNPKALAYSAMALELSYNTISQAVDGQYIGDVHSNGPIIASFDEYLRGGQVSSPGRKSYVHPSGSNIIVPFLIIIIGWLHAMLRDEMRRHARSVRGSWIHGHGRTSKFHEGGQTSCVIQFV